MESQIYEIQRDLKAILKGKRFGNEIDIRMRSLCSQLVRIKDCLIQTNYIGGVFDQYRDLIRNYYMVDNTTMLNLIQNLEDAVISNLITHLKIPATAVANLIRQSRSEPPNQSLDFILPKFLSLTINHNVNVTIGNRKTTFLDFWTINMPNIFEAFQIPANDFIKCLARKILCRNATEPDNTLQIGLRLIDSFMQLFFGNIKNYKFYSKISKIYSEVFSNMPKDKWAQRIKIVPTSLRKAYQGAHTFELGHEFIGEFLGLQTVNFRGDGLIIFGKHPHADIRFPEDEKFIDLVSLIIYNSGSNYYAVDCSTRKTAYCGIKMPQNMLVPSSKNDLISLAKTVLFKIADIDFENIATNLSDSEQTYEYEQSDFKMISSITMTCLEGPYVDNTFRITTKTREAGVFKEEHILGSGGGGVAPDLYIPRESGVSRKHATLVFKENA